MAKKILSSQLRTNIASGVVTNIINAVMMLIAYPVYLGFIGYERYGLWLTLTTVLSFAQLGNLGINHAVIKLVAEEHGRGCYEGIRQYITIAIGLLCLSGTVILLVILGFRYQIVALFKLNGVNAQLTLWLLPWVGLLSIYVFVTQTLASTLSGLGRMDIANLTQTASRIVAIVTATILLYSGSGIESLLIGNFCACLLIHVISMFYIRRMTGLRFLRGGFWDVNRCRRLVQFGSGVFGSSLINMLLDPFNKLILARYAGVATIPIYEIAFRGGMQLRCTFEAGMRALMPEISYLRAAATRQAHQRIAGINRQVMMLIVAFILPLYLVVIAAAPFLLKMWLGKNFVTDLPVIFRITLAGSFLNLLCVPAYYTLLGFGKSNRCFAGCVVQGIINVIVVSVIIINTGSISILTLSWVSLVALGSASVFVIWQKQRVMQNYTPANLKLLSKEQSDDLCRDQDYKLSGSQAV